MKLHRVTYVTGRQTRTVFLRLPYQRGTFLCGVETDEHGWSVRHGCGENELRVKLASIILDDEVDSTPSPDA